MDAARRAARAGEARLILVAGDASAVQLDKLRSVLKNRPIPWAILGDRATLGAAVGLGPISAVAVAAGPLADALACKLGMGGGASPSIVEE